MTDDIAYLTSTRLTELYRSGALSPVEVLESTFSRARVIEPRVNAFTETLWEEALRQARVSERVFAHEPEKARPLEGIPVAIKEEQAMRGHTLRLGSVLTEDAAATADHPVVDRTRGSGAVIHARTTTPEFSAAYSTYTTLWGVTRNPWDLQRTPGGSSGGAAAALAAGTTTLASGSDVAGSIRVPASFCGVVGFKPTYSRIPASAPDNLTTAHHEGPMARTVADCIRYFNVLAGPHPRDPVALPRLHVDERPRSRKSFRLGLVDSVGDYLIDDPVKEALRNAGDVLRGAGIDVVDLQLDLAREDMRDLLLASSADALPPTDPDVLAAMMPYNRKGLRDAAAAASRFSSADARQAIARVQVETLRPFADVDAYLLPVFATLPFGADRDFDLEPLTIGTTRLRDEMDASFTPIFNLASRHPVLSMPIGLSAEGLPIGAQLVARPYADDDALQMGLTIEAILGLTLSEAWRPRALGV